jgi:hypothetical protein
MKFWIWLGCAFVGGLIIALIEAFAEMEIGFLIDCLIATAVFITAKLLCKKVDEKRKRNSTYDD